MAVTCRNLMGLVAFNKLKIVAGSDGLDKLVTWPYIKQTDDIKGWINGGEIVFIVEETKSKEEEYYKNIVNQCNEMMVSAIVFLCGGGAYVSELPQGAKRLGNKYNIPIFEMPHDVRIIDVTREISNAIFQWNYKNKKSENFLDDLIHEDYLNGVQRELSGTFYGFDLDKSFLITVICDKNAINSVSENEVMSLFNKLSVIALKVSMECERLGEKLVSTTSCGTLVSYITINDKDSRRRILKAYNKILEEYNLVNSCEINVGVSKIYSGLEYMPTAYNEARQALIYSMKNQSGKIVCSYEDMGILRFLLSRKDKEHLLQYCDELLAELRAVDIREQAEYERTLWMYLKMNNNLVKTSQALYIHRNTLVNRINKIQSILGKDINEVEVKMEYLNVFSILEFYGKIE